MRPRPCATCHSPLAVGLAVLLVVSWVAGVRPPVRQPPCTGDCVVVDAEDARKARERFEQMRRTLAKEVEDVPKRVLTGGDTCGMRYPGLFRGIDRKLETRFALAVVAQDPDLRLKQLDTLLATEDRLPPVVRLRLDLERVRTLLRAGRIDEAEQLLGAIPTGAVAEVPSACVSDVNFYVAMVAALRGREEEALGALERAVAQDPYSFQARVAYLEALYTRQLRPFRSNGECAAAAATFVEGLHLLRAQLEDARQLLDFADALARSGSPRTKLARLAIAYAYLWGGQQELAVRHAREGLEMSSRLPRACSQLLDEEFGRILAPFTIDDEQQGAGR